MPIEAVLHTLRAGGTMDSSLAEVFFESLLAGALPDARIEEALRLIQARGPAIDELVAGARAMRRHVTPIPGAGSLSGVIIDTCGTGGAPKTFNVSTVAAIVVAAAAPPGSTLPVRVAKHGNRSRTGRGSAEVLARLGVNVDAPPGVQARCLSEAGVCFCFAIHHHPAARHAAAARRAIGGPTLFNLLGPLTNPARADHQVLGIYDASLLPLMGEALARLGARRAWVVHGLDGMDELSTVAPTRVAAVASGAVRQFEVAPEDAGLPRTTREHLVAESLDQAAHVARSVLAGDPGPARDIVVLNAGASLLVAGAAPSLRDSITIACEAIDSGAARRTLDLLASLSRSQ